MTAVHRLAGREKITVVSPDRFVDRIRLHQFVAGSWTEDRVALALSGLLPADAVHVTGSAIAVAPGRVVLDNGSHLLADHVVVAAGSGEGGGVTNLDSRRQVRCDLETLGPGSFVRIDGTGHTGVELAAEIGERRPDLRILQVDPADVLPRVTERARRAVRRDFEQQDHHRDVQQTGDNTKHFRATYHPVRNTIELIIVPVEQTQLLGHPCAQCESSCSTSLRHRQCRRCDRTAVPP
ncbi:hypothetical protein [Kribbella sp. VKM Ac-2571]|uniref:hypothetical protein n=1 Tax=Kribbella sp. VKM Ac-2571 TaxID=2512222 RepID=UPI00105BDCF0